MLYVPHMCLYFLSMVETTGKGLLICRCNLWELRAVVAHTALWLLSGGGGGGGAGQEEERCSCIPLVAMGNAAAR